MLGDSLSPRSLPRKPNVLWRKVRIAGVANLKRGNGIPHRQALDLPAGDDLGWIEKHGDGHSSEDTHLASTGRCGFHRWKFFEYHTIGLLSSAASGDRP
jgi:hypothetical protein